MKTLLLLILTIPLLAQPTPTVARTNPHYVNADPGNCQEGEAIYNLTTHLSKICNSSGQWQIQVNTDASGNTSLPGTVNIAGTVTIGTQVFSSNTSGVNTIYNANGPGLLFRAGTNSNTRSPLVFEKADGTIIAAINPVGAFITQAWIGISGGFTATTDASGNLATFNAAPTGLTDMLDIVSDVGGPGIAVKASSAGGSYNFQGLDVNGNYTFSIGADGKHQWGAGATFVSMDTVLERTASAQLHTNSSLLFDNNVAIQQKDSGGTTRNVLQLDSGNVLHLANAAGRIVFTMGSSNTLRVTNAAQTINLLTVNDAQAGTGIITTNPQAALHVTTSSVGFPNLIVQAIASQTADLLDIEDSSNNKLINVLTNGTLLLPTIKATTGTRYVCVGTDGTVSSSPSACSGT